MSYPNEVRSFAIRAAKAYAGARGVHLCTAFSDTFAGDLARLEVLRSLRRHFPTELRADLEELIEDVLVP